jgi:hypothetical protein
MRATRCAQGLRATEIDPDGLLPRLVMRLLAPVGVHTPISHTHHPAHFEARAPSSLYAHLGVSVSMVFIVTERDLATSPFFAHVRQSTTVPAHHLQARVNVKEIGKAARLRDQMLHGPDREILNGIVHANDAIQRRPNPYAGPINHSTQAAIDRKGVSERKHKK